MVHFYVPKIRTSVEHEDGLLHSSRILPVGNASGIVQDPSGHSNDAVTSLCHSAKFSTLADAFDIKGHDSNGRQILCMLRGCSNVKDVRYLEYDRSPMRIVLIVVNQLHVDAEGRFVMLHIQTRLHDRVDLRVAAFLAYGSVWIDTLDALLCWGDDLLQKFRADLAIGDAHLPHGKSLFAKAVTIQFWLRVFLD